MPSKFKTLRLRMLELDFTQGEVARRIGLAPSTMTARMQGQQPFTAWEMDAIGKLLKIAPTDYCNFFFDRTVIKH